MSKAGELPLVSIVILNWNRIDDTLICLEHVRKIEYPNKEIVVVDNGSQDSSKNQLSHIEDIIFVDNPTNRGFTGGHIDGLEAASGEFIVLLNNDAVMKKDYLSKALLHFEQDESIGAVGGRAYWWNDENPLLTETNNFYSYQTINPITGEAISNQTDNGAVQEVNNVSGSAVMVRRSVIDAIGYLYEPFFAYYEETDLFARMKRAGYKVLYDPELAIWHKMGASSTSYFQFYQLYKNRFVYAIRNFDRSYLASFIAAYIKTGLRYSVYRLKKTENQTLYRAFSDAFIRNLLLWPKAFLSRRTLNKDFPGRYNHKLITEQNPVSFIVDTTEDTSKQSIQSWVDYARTNARHEFIFVINKRGSSIPNLPNIRTVQDRGYFETHAVNLGWLIARYNFVYFVLESNLPPSIEVVENAKIIYESAGRSEIIQNDIGIHPNINVGMLIAKDLLVRHGGLEHELPLKAAKYSLLTYAALWSPRKQPEVSSKFLPLTSLSDLLKNKDINDIEARIASKVLIDKPVGKLPIWWTRTLERHYRLYQSRNYTKWLFSPRITLRLKAARTKNLVLFAATLRRQMFATELKHIRNEVIRTSFRGVNIEAQNKYVKNLLRKLQKDPLSIPVLIICRDRLDPLLVLVDWLEKSGFKKIILIDNDSIYPPLVKYLETTQHQVIPTGQNIGHTVPWNGGIIKTLLPKSFYIVTDPDVVPTEYMPKDSIRYLLDVHKKYFMYQKVGFGLKIDDLPDHYTLKDSVIAWESQFWKYELGKNIFEAGVDTTFALYKPFNYKYFLHPSIRTGEPYTARHLPWYLDSTKLTQEEKFYRARVNNQITSWNVDALAERYIKELNKN